MSYVVCVCAMLHLHPDTFHLQNSVFSLLFVFVYTGTRLHRKPFKPGLFQCQQQQSSRAAVQSADLHFAVVVWRCDPLSQSKLLLVLENLEWREISEEGTRVVHCIIEHEADSVCICVLRGVLRLPSHSLPFCKRWRFRLCLTRAIFLMTLMCLFFLMCISGELLAEACQLGTAHPPGYPLFTLLSHCALYLGGFPRLFWNASSGNLVVDTKPTSGWKMNNLTAIFASLAAAFIALACLEMTLITSIQPLEKKGRYRHTLAPSSLAALSFAFSSLVWEYAIGAEVFALNNLFCAIIIYLTVSIIADSSENRSSESSEYLPIGRTMFWYCLLGAFTCGLALSNQHSSALLIAVAVPSVLVAISSRDIGPSFLFLLSVSFVFGLLSYNYLMFASLHPKPGSWGDLGNIYGFLNHVLRREYGTFSLGMTQGAEGFLERIWIYLLHLFDDGLMHSLVPLVIFGVCGVLFDHNSMFNTTMSNMSMKRIENDKLMQERKLSGTDSAFKKSKKKRLKEKRDKPEGLDDRVSINKKSDTLKVESSKQRNFAEGKATGPTVSSVSTGFRKDLKQYWVLLFVVASWAFYVVVWNGVLSNIPLSAPMPYGVHARFWMQPNIFVHILFGLGLHYLFRSISYTCFKNLNDLTNAAFEMSVVLAAILAIISGKFERLDMSQDGWLMHNYGLHILQSTSYPNDALLLSHTDLNWNTVRYLQTCENLSRNTTSLHSDVTLTHLNFQLMPFPWFEKQQAPIYPQVSFPPMFHGVSTQRMSTANAVLVDRFLKANMFFENDDVETEFPIWGRRRPTFLDMQAINDIHIDSGGTWRNYTLIPWGLVYLVHEKVHMQQLGAFHSYSLLQLKRLRKSFIPILHDNVTSLNKYLSTPIFIETVRNADVTENGQNVKVLFALSGPKKRVPFLLKFPPGECNILEFILAS